tara:strand:+ start:313 stop:561 length:249 start_codon:yes stop_codon:yes gene_type:complete
MDSGSIFISDMDANKVEDLLNKKRKIEQEIAHIQSGCIHTTQYLRMVHQGSSNSVRWTCKECSQILGWPNDKELQQFLNKKV